MKAAQMLCFSFNLPPNLRKNFISQNIPLPLPSRHFCPPLIWELHLKPSCFCWDMQVRWPVGFEIILTKGTWPLLRSSLSLVSPNPSSSSWSSLRRSPSTPWPSTSSTSPTMAPGASSEQWSGQVQRPHWCCSQPLQVLHHLHHHHHHYDDKSTITDGGVAVAPYRMKRPQDILYIISRTRENLWPSALILRTMASVTSSTIRANC